LRTVLTIEWPVLNLVLRDGTFYEECWQPERRFWNGRSAVVPEPYQAGDGPDIFFGGHEPGPGCVTRTCWWMNRALTHGHRL
jgi:hypothetical protein